MTQVDILLKNDWIEEYGGTWVNQVVLAAKPHQEHVNYIKHFVWRTCVSYRGLNKVTKIYEYPIPRCDMNVIIFEVGSSKMWLITVDAKHGYHQIGVR